MVCEIIFWSYNCNDYCNYYCKFILAWWGTGTLCETSQIKIWFCFWKKSLSFAPPRLTTELQIKFYICIDKKNKLKQNFYTRRISFSIMILFKSLFFMKRCNKSSSGYKSKFLKSKWKYESFYVYCWLTGSLSWIIIGCEDSYKFEIVQNKFLVFFQHIFTSW